MAGPMFESVGLTVAQGLLPLRTTIVEAVTWVQLHRFLSSVPNGSETGKLLNLCVLHLFPL